MYCTGSYTQYPVITYMDTIEHTQANMGKHYEKEYMYMYKLSNFAIYMILTQHCKSNYATLKRDDLGCLLVWSHNIHQSRVLDMFLF